MVVGETCGAREYVRTRTAPRLRPRPARIDCDEWRLLWIPDRDRELGGRAGWRSVLLNCFFPAAVSLDYWKPRRQRRAI